MDNESTRTDEIIRVGIFFATASQSSPLPCAAPLGPHLCISVDPHRPVFQTIEKRDCSAGDSCVNGSKPASLSTASTRATYTLLPIFVNARTARSRNGKAINSSTEGTCGFCRRNQRLRAAVAAVGNLDDSYWATKAEAQK